MSARMKLTLTVAAILGVTLVFAGEMAYKQEQLPDGSTVMEYSNADGSKVRQVQHKDGTLETDTKDAQGNVTTMTQHPDGRVDMKTK